MDLSFFIHIAHAAEEVAQPTSPVAVLGLNWQLFIAQLINFGVILFILWKWVFTPVAKKLQERTDKIEKAIKDAGSTEKEKQEFAVWKEEEIKKARQQAGEVIAQAQKDAITAKDEIMAQAKTEQVKLVEQSKAQIMAEKEQQMQVAKAELADMVTGVAEKILRHKLDGAKDKELIKDSLKSI